MQLPRVSLSWDAIPGMVQVSGSPAGSPAQAQAACTHRRLAVSGRLSTQGAEIEDLKKENTRLQTLVSELRKDSPSVARLTDLAVWREREAFEEKTRRALALLRRKDAKIRELGDVVARRRHVAGGAHRASAKGGERNERGDSTGKSCADTSGSHGDYTPGRAKVIAGNENAKAAPGVVKRLEQCVREQEEQIGALVEEVARLRAAQPPIAQPPDVREATGSFKEADEERNCPDAWRTVCTWEDGTTNGQAVEELRNRVAQLKFALSAQAADLTQKGAALDEVLKARQREQGEAREREATLAAKLRTLEHLQETARRTILEREEQLRQANAKLSAHSKLYKDTDSGRSHADGAGGSSCVVDASTCTDKTVGSANIPLVSEDSNTEPATAARSHLPSPTPKGLQEFLGAQEWWMSLAVAAEKRDDYASAARPETRDSVGYTSALEPTGAERKCTIERLRQLLRDQGLEVVTLRQKMLQVEIASREKMAEQTEREAAAERRIVTLNHALRTSKMEGSTRVSELEIQVAKLRAREDIHEELAAARDEVTAGKLDVVRAEGNANLHSQLLEEEKERSAAALSRAEDLQGKLDRIAVADTLRGVPGGVSASSLIESFVGTALRQSQHVQALEDDIRNMHARCARLAREARGEPADSADIDMTARGETRRAGNRIEGQAERQSNDWEEAAVQEAAVAMESGRRRALEDEVEGLKKELLTQRRRTEALQRKMEDDRQHGPAVGVALGSGRQQTEVDTLRRELLRATSEIEALRAHAADLRSHLRSNSLRFHISKGADGHADDGTHDNGDASVAGSLSGVRSGAGNTAAATALKTEISITNFLGKTNDSCLNCARLDSLLAEKNAQVGVLTATVGALQVPPTSALSSPREFDGDLRRSGIGLRRGRSASPCGRAGRGGKHAASGAHSLAAWDDCAVDVDGGVAILSHIGAQGLVRHCVALATRLTATMGRAWAKERRADRDAAEMERKERELNTTRAKLIDLLEKYRLLDLERGKMAAALKQMQAESAVRLREAGEEGSKLRRALRDAELGTVNARHRLQSAIDEGHALETELQKGRERHQGELTHLSDEHIARLNELAHRLCGFESTSRSHSGAVEGEPGASSTSMLTAASPMAGAIAQLTEQWRSYVANQEMPLPRRSSRQSKSLKTDSDDADITNRSERQRGVAAFIQETMVSLGNECSRAVRRARALEWELRGARQDARDRKTALDEARVERARLLARVTAAEAAVVASCHVVTMASSAGSVPAADVDNSFCFADGSSGGTVFAVTSLNRNNAAGSWEGGVGGHGPGTCTVAAFSLLEKRLAAAVEDLVAAEAARAAAEVGEMTATERAAAAEVEAAGARAAVDVLKAELERHKTMATDRVRADALEWRREIRADIGRWWHDDLMHLHNGIALDWGSSGAADEAAAVGTTFTPDPSRSLPSHHENHRYFRGDVGVNLGVTGEDAMAQALIAGRAEQAIVEERLLVQEQYLARVRGEVLHLRSILERWHGEFVIPAMEAKRRRSVAAAATAASVRPTPKVSIMGGNNRVDAGALAATTELLCARDKVAELREEVSALRALVGKVREDERDAREAADRRIQSARETVQRRAEGDLRDANECLAEERERFKSQLGAAHADILRLGAELAELERRNQQLERERSAGKIRSGFDDSTESTHRLRSKSSPSDVLGWGDSGGSRKERGQAPANGKEGAFARERGLREAAEEEREALRRMCNGLAIDLKTAVGAKAEAEEERQAVVQEATKAKAEALTARLAREVQEAALEELGRLLEVTRRGVTMPDVSTECGEGGDQALRSTGPVEWERSREEARRFAKIMTAAKVTEADLQRRLQAASASEAELRHKIRRLDRRIEELKGEQMKTICLTGASATPRSTLAGHRSTNSLECALNYRGEFAPGTGTPVKVDHEQISAKHAEKEISQAATIMQLELDLAEAAARGDVGEASASAASRLALRLLSKGERGVCNLCSRPIPPPPQQQQQQQQQPQPRDTRDTRTAMRFSDSQQGRGASFLMPSVEIERKAARAGQSGNAEHNKARAQEQVPAPAAAPMTRHAGAVAHSLEGSGEHSDVEGVSNQRCRLDEQTSRRSGKDGGLSTDGFDRSHTQPPAFAEADTTATQKLQKQGHQGLSHSVALLEAQLARMARDLGEDGRCAARKGQEKDDVEGDSHGMKSHSPVSHVFRSARASWVEAVRELKGQVAELRDRAVCTEEILNEDNAIQQELRREVQRLRAQLLRQKRSYWQATAVLKDRYRRALAAGAADKYLPSTAAGTRIKRGRFPEKSENVDEDELAVDDVVTNAQRMSSNRPTARVREVEQPTSQGGNPTGEPKVTEPSQAEVEVCSLRESLRNTEHRLAEKEQEMQDIRRVHVQEVEKVKHEVKRAAEAQRARVEMLESKAQRARIKVKAMARRKMGSVQHMKGRAAIRNGRGDGDSSTPSPTSVSAPFSVDELLNMLAAADEETFEAKGRAQRAEYGLRVRAAEADALRRSMSGTSKGCNAAAAPSATEEGDGGVCPPKTEDQDRRNQAMHACAGVGVFASVACAARLETAEVEVERLRDEGLAANEKILEVQREVSALRFAASRASAANTSDGRAREKELQKQVSRLKRETGRLRNAAGGVLFPGAEGGKANRTRAEAAATGEATVKSRAQLAAAREDSERRARTITALRTAKSSLEKQLEQSQRKLAVVDGRLNRALKDVGVKDNALQTLRGKICALEAEIEAARKITRLLAAAPAPTADSTRESANEGATTGAAVSGVDSKTPLEDCHGGHGNGSGGNNSQETVVRDLRAERDRLQTSMRARQGLLAKKTAELDTRTAELHRVEQQACSLRAAVARKDDAYRTTKKQLLSVRQEYDLFRASSQRWQADAEIEWRNLKRASESAAREVKTFRKTGDAATQELIALKSAFRSFLKTLWDDLLSRPPGLIAAASVRRHNEPTSDVGSMRRTNAPSAIVGPLDNIVASHTGKAVVPTSTNRGIRSDSAGQIAPYTSSAAVSASMAGGAGHSRGDMESPGPLEGGFGELTEAEVVDIMQALRMESPSSSSSVSTPPAALMLRGGPAQYPVFPGSAVGASYSEDSVTVRPDVTPKALSPPQAMGFEGDDEFSARVGLALGDRDTSEALAKMLRSIRASGNSWREQDGKTGSDELLVPTPPPQPQPPPPSVTAS